MERDRTAPWGGGGARGAAFGLALAVAAAGAAPPAWAHEGAHDGAQGAAARNGEGVRDHAAADGAQGEPALETAPAAAGDDGRSAGPAVSRPGEPKATARTLGLVYPVDFFADETGGVASMLTIEVPAGRGAPPHVHSREAEIFVILEGEYLFRAGDSCFRATPGTKVFLPRGLAHAFRVVGDRDGRHIVTAIPGGMESLFFEIEERGLELPADAAALRALAETRYGLTFLPPGEHGVDGCPDPAG